MIPAMHLNDYLWERAFAYKTSLLDSRFLISHSIGVETAIF